jgi:4-amino-4-deoxy-L-arabinose transferase-like glycosyltransferase
LRLILLLALLNAALYSCLLPLWEGFDEPFHYAYVESLSANKQIPVLKQTPISAEIRASLDIVPISFILKRSIPGTIAFEDWFSFSRAEQARRIRELRAIPSEQRKEPSSLLNYEAQQTPLAYLVLAPLDAMVSKAELPTRILILRLVLSLAATILTFGGCRRLCYELGLSGSFQILLLVTFFEMQIFAAAVCHVANDWLAITAGVWFFALMASLVNRHRTRDAYLLSVVAAIGLLSKAYFLAFVPVFLTVLVYERWRLRLLSKTVIVSVLITLVLAGPWYGRNLLLYKSLAGLQEDVGVGSSPDVFYAFQHMNWSKTLLDSARLSLWTGNESHISFSQNTLNLQLLLFGATFVLFAVQIRKARTAEIWTLGASLIFIGALLYDLCIAAGAHELQTTTGPYYAPCILPAVLALACLGLQRSGTLGRILAMALCLVSAWIAALTYVAKLLPYYGGFIGRSTVGALWNWWTEPSGHATLAVTTLAPAGVVYLLLLCFLVTLTLLTAQIVRTLNSAVAASYIS